MKASILLVSHSTCAYLCYELRLQLCTDSRFARNIYHVTFIADVMTGGSTGKCSAVIPL